MQPECRIYQVALKVMRGIYLCSLKMKQISCLTLLPRILKEFTQDLL
ncbi:ORF135 [Staphylococcus phage X2]|uniref:ORF135 n=1 Tax=Staphylococcus phage X2 TaxID=2908152 RepID=Q4ZA87_9CAUD|nr:ORF135 [Staphylococcus phage X2]AAX92076.1 ORF135 [Staphylococcus phage X2]